jgi:selenocysteine-specific elongation factor
MQMFRKPVDKAIQGDRIGLCVTQFDPDKLERGLVCKKKKNKFLFIYI